MMFENILPVQKSESSTKSKATPTPLIEMLQIERRYPSPHGSFYALKDINLSIGPGRLIAVVGPSGSGKSTLLNLISGIDRPTAGSLSLAGRQLVQLSEDEMSLLRGQKVGVVFQFFQLLPTLTSLENVLLPMDLVGVIPPKKRQERALLLLSQMGVQDQAEKFPQALSGGQQQRVAIARALANDPPLCVADEPTGNLDSATKDQVFSLLRALTRQGKTVLMATHEQSHLAEFDEVIFLQDGRIVNRQENSNQRTPREDESCCSS